MGDRYEHRPDPSQPLAGRVGAHIAAGEYDRALALVGQASGDLAEHPQLRDAEIALLHHTGRTEQALDLAVENAARRIAWLEDRRRRVGTGTVTLQRRQRILIAGFFKSGSSAVVDYLRGAPGVVKWAPGGEMRLVKSAGGMADLVKRHRAHGRLAAGDLVDFYLHLTGRKVTSNPPGTYDRWEVVNRNSAALFADPRAFGYLSVCLTGFQRLVDLAAGRPGADELADLFRATVEQALAAAATDTQAQALVVDQAVNAWRLRISRLLPPSTFVLVHRDPRDQFVDVRAVRRQPGRKDTDAEMFVQEYLRRRRQAERDITGVAARHGHRCRILSFEDFVLDHADHAHQLTTWLDLPPALRGGRYVPARGLAGVGHHRGQLTPAEHATLVSGLEPFLDPRAGA